MSLSDLIYKKRKNEVATATVATPATHGAEKPRSVATVARVAVANTEEERFDAANCSKSSNCSSSKPRDLEIDIPITESCSGALLSSDGGFFLPWGPHLSSADVLRMRAELVDMIELIARMEGWPLADLDDVLTRAMRGPLSDLMPNLAYFRERLDRARAAAATGKKR